MAKLAIKKGAVDQSIYIFAQDSSKTTGEGLTGLTNSTSGLVASYVRPRSARVAISLASVTVAGAHVDGGFVAVDAANMPGLYRLDLPDAVFATGVSSAVVMLQGAENLAPVLVEVQLVGFDPDVALATASAVSAIPTNPLLAANYTAPDNAGIAAIKAKTDNLPADPADDSDIDTAIAAVKSVVDAILVDTGTTLDAKLNTIDTNVDAILADTGTDGVKSASGQTVATVTNLTNLPTMPADWVTASGLKADAVTEIQSGLATAAALTTVDNEVGTIDGIVDAIKAKTDNLPANTATALAAIQSDLDNPAQYKADVSALATQASVNAIPTTPLLAANYVAPDNASIAAILEDTGTTIPATLAGLATSAEVGAIALLGETVVGSYTVQDILKILAAKMVGKATGGGTTTITYRGVDDLTDVIIETVDSNGNRSDVTLTV